MRLIEEVPRIFAHGEGFSPAYCRLCALAGDVEGAQNQKKRLSVFFCAPHVVVRSGGYGMSVKVRGA